MKSLINIKRQFQETAWLLGICENGYNDLKAGRIHWIDNGEYKGKKWFADPFILKYDNERITLLVEEFDYKVHRGRIARLYVDRNCWTVTDCKIILDLDTHLSFPMIWREDGKFYICPENYKSGGWNMYEFDVVNEKLTLCTPLIKEQLTDAIIYKDEMGYYVLSTCIPTPNGKKLIIYHSDKLNGDYNENQEVLFSENIARNAGSIFLHNGMQIRPAQVCNENYGQAISFQVLTRENGGEYTFKESFRFFSPHPKFKYGSHTFNQHPNGMAVIDVKGWRHSIVGPLIKNTGNFFVKLGVKNAYKPQ